jgi:hypothetical protein
VRTEWAKVNIDADCLQAIIHRSAHEDVGNPEPTGSGMWASVI